MPPSVGAGHDRKVTPGITASSRARAPIDPAVCDIDVGSSHPGGAAAPKGGAARPLKGNVSWVQTVVRQRVVPGCLLGLECVFTLVYDVLFYLDYLAGLVAGDGNITWSRHRIRVYDSCRIFLEYVCELCKSDLKIESCTIYWDRGAWCLSIYDEKLVKELSRKLKKPDNEIEWLKGFVDAEGSVYIWVRKRNKAYCQVSITNTNEDYISLASSILDRIGIKYRIVVVRDKWKPRKRILINRLKDLHLFFKIIGFRNQCKNKRLSCLQYQ